MSNTTPPIKQGSEISVMYICDASGTRYGYFPDTPRFQKFVNEIDDLFENEEPPLTITETDEPFVSKEVA